MKTEIISESVLAYIAGNIDEATIAAGPDLLENKLFGNTLKYYVLLTDHLEAVQETVNLTAEAIYVNRYFYFIKFYKLYIVERGDNDGIYQMYMSLLEDRPDSLPWEELKYIEDDIDNNLAHLNIHAPKILQA